MALILGTNCGFVTEAPVADPDDGAGITMDHLARAIKDTSPVGATSIIEIGWYSSVANEEANFEVAIYSHDGGNDKPNAIVGSKDATNAKGTTEGWKRVTGLNIVISAGTVYWIAVQCDETIVTTRIDANVSGGPPRLSVHSAEFALEDPWSAGSNEEEAILAIYAVHGIAEVPIVYNRTWIDCSSTKPDVLEIVVDGDLIGKGNAN